MITKFYRQQISSLTWLTTQYFWIQEREITHPHLTQRNPDCNWLVSLSVCHTHTVCFALHSWADQLMPACRDHGAMREWPWILNVLYVCRISRANWVLGKLILRKWVDLIDTPIEFWERNLTHLMRQYIGVAVHTLKPGITQNIMATLTCSNGRNLGWYYFIYLFYLFQSTMVMDYLYFDDR